MDRLLIAPEEIVKVVARNGKQIRVTPHMHEALGHLREYLKSVARAKATSTYTEAASATGDAYLPRGLGSVLDVLSEDCFRRDEPSLASLVVRADVGEVGDAFVGDAADERQACYRHWSGR